MNFQVYNVTVIILVVCRQPVLFFEKIKIMKYNYHTIVLEKFNIGEADRLYTFYTLEGGLMRVPAKSIRKKNAKLAAQVEDFVLTHVTIVKGYGRGILAGAVVENYFVNLHENFFAMKCVDEVRTIFLAIVEEGDVDERIFALFVQYLIQIDQIAGGDNDTEIKFNWLTQAFLIQLFSLFGYDFYINKCSVCKNKIITAQNGFSAERGGIICNKCFGDEYVYCINLDTLKAMRIIQNNKLSSMIKVNIDDEVYRQLNKIVVNIEKWIMR